MVNQQFGQSNDPYWYPHLPEGYSDNRGQHQGGPVPMPGQEQTTQNFHSGMPGHSQPTQSFHGNISGFPPPFGGPNQSFPGFPGQSGRPNHNFPGFPGQSGGTSFPPGQHPNGNAAPQGPPPNWTPEYPEMQTRAIDPGAISGCMYRFTYVWLSRRQGFWFFPVFVGPRSVAGYRWNSRRRRWEYTGIDLNQINSFTCI